MYDRLPIIKNELFTEWFGTGFEFGWYESWLHGKYCDGFPCMHSEMLSASVDRIKADVDWKLFMTRFGSLAGFVAGLEQTNFESLWNESGEGDSHA